MVHQELQILPLMNVEENIFIGEESSRRGFVKKKRNAEEKPGIAGNGWIKCTTRDKGCRD